MTCYYKNHPTEPALQPTVRCTCELGLQPHWHKNQELRKIHFYKLEKKIEI